MSNQPEAIAAVGNEITNPRSGDENISASAALFAGGSEMGALVRAFDWSKTPLGPVETWSPALVFTTRLLLANCSPMLLWWGPDFISIYNDAYIPVLGEKHPHAALGKPLRECWQEVFHVLEPLVQTPFEGGRPTWMEDIYLEVNRFGFVEESHFTVGYSPVPDATAPRGIGGVLATVHEITEKVVSERRVAALRDLGTKPFAAATAEEACAAAADTLANYGRDLPFLLLYLIDGDGTSARLAGEAGVGSAAELKPERVNLGDGIDAIWPLASARERERFTVVDDLRDRCESLPTGPLADPPHSAAIVPIQSNIAHHLAGFLVAGLSPRLRFDDGYRGFLELVSAQIAMAIANARAYEEERKRNEALAEIDRAKTAFFTNISHEFRTPLTLMMGPIEDALQRGDDLPAVQRERLELAHRNSLRLLKLVNTLLDFARMEAGRMQAAFEPLDLAQLTSELASVFRSAIERAGLKLVIDCPPLGPEVYVDREIWEKVVLNLLSNALKFTLQGSIEVKLRPAGDVAELTVSDTGVGIAESDLPHVFERFYRVRNSQARSYEGSGIGLALVQELVKLNGGKVSVTSRAGSGSTFTVAIPFGTAHLPKERIGVPRAALSTAIGVDAYVQEALRWLPGTETEAEGAPAAMAVKSPGKRARIVLAEDNADMRDYIRRLLADAYEVEAASDGEAALGCVLRDPPDLVLTDIMMPGLDGFGLLNALRSDERTASIPVILVSARAGEESRVEGVNAGADDCLVKPFSARELVARVENHLALSRVRRETECRVRESEERFRALVAARSDVIYRMSPDWSEMRQLRGRNFVVDTDEPDRGWVERYIHPDDRPMVMAAIQEAIRTRSVFELEHRVLRVDGTLGWTFSRAVPLLNAAGEIVEWFGAASDVTVRKQSEQALLRSEKLATLGRMAATIAHEINNPLEAVTNLLFLTQLSGNLPGQANEYLRLAEIELRRIAHITRQSLGFYRESNAPAVTGLTPLVDSSIELLKNKIEEKGAVIQRAWRSSPEVVAVAGELRQVFSNLLANSLDALDKNGVIKVRVSAHGSDGRGVSPLVRVTVSDNGKGIESAARPHIFEPFFTTKGAVGTGLGLWVTKQIVDKHRGTIRVRSCCSGARKGTTFSIVFPARQLADPVAAENAAQCAADREVHK